MFNRDTTPARDSANVPEKTSDCFRTAADPTMAWVWKEIEKLRVSTEIREHISVKFERGGEHLQEVVVGHRKLSI